MLSHRARRPSGSTGRGQSMVELALVAPLLFTVVFGIIVLGIGVFFQQQTTNAAREGARYAALHSATSRCPTVSNRTPDAALLPLPNSYFACDAPATRWPKMTGAAREYLFGLSPSRLNVTACWSGYWTKDTSGGWAAHDEVATNVDGSTNAFRECTVRVFGWCPGQGGASTSYVINPRSGEAGACSGSDKTVEIDCARAFPLTTLADDMASSFAKSDGRNANQVTVLTCYAWRPPLAGFLLIPETVHMTAVITETMEYQQ